MADPPRSVEQRLAELGGPQPLPAGLRHRLEDALLTARQRPTDQAGNPLAGVDAPVALPVHLQHRLDAALTGRRRPRRPVVLPWLAAAAAVLLVLGAVTAIVRPSSSQHRRPQSDVAAGAAPSANGLPPADLSTTTSVDAGGAAAAGISSASGSLGAAGSAAGSSAGAGSASGPGGRGTPPPFTFGAGNQAAHPATGSSVRVGVLGGDAAEEAGFRAYLDLLNRSGGAGGHALRAVPTSPGAPAANVAVTVNLSGAPIATTAGPPPWVTGPLLETLPVPSAVLAGRVFDLASPIERQAHLVVDALYPDNAPGHTAVIYQSTDGPYGAEAPQALDEALRSRQVTPLHVDVRQGQATPLVAADAAFLSLDTAAATGWLDQAKGANYAPTRGVAGVSSLLDAMLLPKLPEGTRVLSPYLVPSGNEAAAMSAGTHRPPSDAVTHGWVTAKALAAVVWQSDATTPDAVLTGLRALKGFDDGFAPPYQTRSGGNARLPDGVVYRVTSSQFVQQGGFVTDSR